MGETANNDSNWLMVTAAECLKRSKMGFLFAPLVVNLDANLVHDERRKKKKCDFFK